MRLISAVRPATEPRTTPTMPPVDKPVDTVGRGALVEDELEPLDTDENKEVSVELLLRPAGQPSEGEDVANPSMGWANALYPVCVAHQGTIAVEPAESY